MHSIVSKRLLHRKKNELGPVREWDARVKDNSVYHFVMTNISIHFPDPMACHYPAAQQTPRQAVSRRYHVFVSLKPPVFPASFS